MLAGRMKLDAAAGDPALADAAREALDAAYSQSDLYFKGWTGQGVNSDLYRTERTDLGTLQYSVWYETGQASLTDQFAIDLGREALVQVSVPLGFGSSGGLRIAALTTDVTPVVASQGVFVDEVWYNSAYDSSNYDWLVQNIGTGTQFESYAHFSLAGLTSQEISEATLDLYAIYGLVQGTPEHAAKVVPGYTWNPGITWNNHMTLAPGVGDAIATWTPHQDWNSIPITDAVRRAVRVGDMNFSGELLDTEPNSPVPADFAAFEKFVRNETAYHDLYDRYTAIADNPGTALHEDVLYRGDANHDGAVDAGDTERILRQLQQVQGDYDFDDHVDIFEMNWISTNWGTGDTYVEADFNLDGTVNVFDQNVVSSDWGSNPNTTVVPTLTLRMYDTGGNGQVVYTGDNASNPALRAKLTITQTPDLVIKGFASDGTDLTVTYIVTHDEVDDPDSFDIGIYRSYDGQSLDTGMMTFPVDYQTLDIDNNSALAPGLHTLSIPVDQDFVDNDVQDDYYLVAVLDDSEAQGEPLEDNNVMLFQGGVFLDAADNLHVHGTDDDDLITVADDEITIDTLDGSPFAVDLTEAAAVYVWAHAGNDEVSTDAEVATPMSIHGGEGDDVLQGGAAHDEIFGGAGLDEIFGGAGDDLLYGDEDEDSLDGGDGNDYLDGGSEDDELTGGAGSDYLVGGEDTDTLTGGTGIDRFDTDEDDPTGGADHRRDRQSQRAQGPGDRVSHHGGRHHGRVRAAAIRGLRVRPRRHARCGLPGRGRHLLLATRPERG